MRKVLVTGGTGYIGSHCCVSLLEAGYDVVILDNFSNSSPKVLDRIQTITNQHPDMIEGDIRDQSLLNVIFEKHNISAIIHMAGYKSVGESVTDPLAYYHVNVEGSRTLIDAALRHNIQHFIFSSSATVYGPPQYLPIDENHPLSTTNPYGETKRVVEEMLQSVQRAHPNFKTGILRYFNPMGAHESGLIGEFPKGIPNNLMPYVAQVANGLRDHVNIFGNDYDTKDGTGVRDYIHVVDLALAHVAALDVMEQKQESLLLNIGTGQGYSVLEMIDNFRKASGSPIPIKIKARRQGDVATCYTNPEKANKVIGWRAKYNLERMCKDQWRWQSENPNGYETDA